MATTIEGQISEALFGRLGSLVLSPVLPIAWPNLTFSPPSNQRYLRAQFVPNMTDRFLIDSDGPHDRQGFLQVTLHWTKGQGEVAARDVAGQVAAWFPCDLALVAGAHRLRVTKAPEVRDVLIGDASIEIPVMISWQVFA